MGTFESSRGIWGMKIVLNFLKKWVPAVTAMYLSISLLYIARDYPCLKGAGLALADFEAFILLVLIALPSMIWAIARLLCVRPDAQLTLEDRWINRLAVTVICIVMLYALLAIPVIFSFSLHPLRFVCQ